MAKALSRYDTLLCCFFGAAVFLDIPAAKAYNAHTAWTEIAGRYLFHGVKELLGVPVPLTPFEVGSYLSLLMLLAAYGWQRARVWVSLIFLALLLPLATGFATISGIMRGNSLSLAMTQLHFIPLLSAWLAIGYFVGTRPTLLGRLLRILYWVCLWRAVYALYVYAFIYKFSMGDNEYLIDHTVSIFFACGMVYALLQAWFHRSDKQIVLAYTASALLQFLPFMLNDRRASYAGLTAAVLMLPWILSRRMRRALLRPYKYALVLGVGMIAFFSLRTTDQYSFVGAFKTETLGAKELTYRHIENYNLLVGMIKQPVLGMGFGTRFPKAIELPDISFAFELFDAIPHNSVYFLWGFGGPIGLASLMTLSCGLLCVVTRVGRQAQSKSQILLALTGLVVLSQWLMYCLFDMGLLESRSLMLVGIFTGGLFPVYARNIWELSYEKLGKKKQQETDAESAAGEEPQPLSRPGPLIPPPPEFVQQSP